ncbi:hypothetical protein HU200_037984 [Digitaria exilis]|uniref:Eukaryotic translation initiation factor 3 subunit B n=1 Tax=Digitaria exilis TaxID=1010633 RepID=A0A835EKY0_9POAL|nr:hypothetical protein HU200_037984 [Digitaria exilis]
MAEVHSGLYHYPLLMTMDGIEARARELGIDLYSVDLDTITLPAGEDSSILSDNDDDEILKNENLPELEMGYANTIVVDNLPVVLPEMFEKLEIAIRKFFSHTSVGVIKEDGFWMPVNPDTNMTCGYCFIEYNTPEEAELAKEICNGLKLDKSHPFVVNVFDDFERYKKVPDEWMPPEIKPCTRGENLQRWITDEKARDQFVIRAGTSTEVYWNDTRQLVPELVYRKQFWTDSFIEWSPLGTYLATVHRQGSQVWGGEDKFERLMRFAHPQRVVLNIFDVRTGKLMRGFKGTTDEFMTDTFSLIDKKCLKLESVLDFCWSPTDPIIALFVPEMGGGNQPARVCLVHIPGKEELRQKNLFSVSDCKMYWQNNGEYLAVQVDRYTKTKKTTYSGFELFRIKEKDIPIEVLELDNKSTRVIAFAWEPSGHRFAVIHGDDHRPDISFYSMQTANNPCRVSKLITLKSKEANALYWCPSGRFILLAGLKGFNGKLEFYNVDALETMSTTDHLMATDIMWDPTGRYVATAVTSVHEMENGFHIWSFNGKLLYKVLKDNFFQFLWRPRPQSLLASEKEEEISRNLKKYSKRYEQEDQVTFNQLSELQHKKQKQLQEEWDAWVAKWKQQHKEERELRVELRDGEASDEEQEYEAKEVEMDEVVEIKEEVVTFELGQE